MWLSDAYVEEGVVTSPKLPKDALYTEFNFYVSTRTHDITEILLNVAALNTITLNQNTSNGCDSSNPRSAWRDLDLLILDPVLHFMANQVGYRDLLPRLYSPIKLNPHLVP